MRYETLLTLLIFMLLLVLVSFGAGWMVHRCTREPETKVEVKTVYKTVFVDRPEPVKTKILPDRYFFIPVESLVQITQHDTTYLQLPVEQKEYQDSLYHAWVSGYRPQLDSIRLNIPTTYITTTVRERASRWSLGVTAGPGLLVTPEGRLHGGLGVTVGLQMRF